MPVSKKKKTPARPAQKAASKKPAPIKLVIGLGNPGKEFDMTRHNIGRDIVLALAKTHEIESQETKEALVCEGKIQNTKVLLLLPELFMNNSGKSIKQYSMKVKPAQILVVHDDVDIPFGNIKLSFGKHSAGHKGVESVMRALGSIEFWRLRVGIAPLGKKIPAMQLVLKKFTPPEQTALKKVIKKAVSILETAILESPERALSEGI